MRVGFDITPLSGPPSGVGTYTDCLLAHLSQGDEAIIPLSHYPVDFRWSANGKGNGNQGGSQSGSSAFTRPLNKTLWMQFQFRKRMKELDLDLCHFTNSVAPLWSPVPSVITIHDMTLWLMPSYHPRRRLLAMRPVVPIAARQAAAIIAVSNSTKDDIVRVLGVSPEKIAVIYEAPHPSFKPLNGSPDVTHARKKFGLPEKFLLHVGTLEPRKNLVRLLEAFAQLKEGHALPHKLVLVGKRGWNFGDIFGAVERLDLEREVVFLDFVSSRWLPAIYNLADALVFPSLYEGFGLPLVEAMACGTPVIASPKGALKEIAGDAAVYIDPEDVDDMALVISQTLADSQLMTGIKLKGLDRASQFSWQKAAELTQKLYQNVAAGEYSADSKSGAKSFSYERQTELS